MSKTLTPQIERLKARIIEGLDQLLVSAHKEDWDTFRKSTTSFSREINSILAGWCDYYLED